jgi:hypothetical protein
MIEMKIRSLKDQSLKTSCGSYWLVEGEIKRVTFKNMAEFDAYVEMGVFKPVSSDTPESKIIPVIEVPMDEEGLPLELHDGENALPLSNDPEEEGDEGELEDALPEPVFDPELEVDPEEFEEEVDSEESEEEVDPEESEEEESEEDPEDEEDETESWEDDGDWTNQIDHVG